MSAPAAEVRAQLRDWILKNGKVKDPAALTGETPLVASGILSSLQIMELILFLERAADVAIDVEQLRPGTFKNMDSILASFLPGGGAT